MIVRSNGGFSRRALLKGATILALSSQVGPFVSAAKGQSTDEDARTLDLLKRSERDPRRRILLQQGTILTMDPTIGDFAKADLLIEGTRIAAIAPDLANAVRQGQGITINASAMILTPGFVDAHRHSWAGQLRGIIPNAGISEYMGATHRGFAPFYRPEDMYAGNLITALGCIDAGITCIIDNSHNSRSPEHSNQALKALFDSGIRAVHASGAPTFGEWQRQWPNDLERLQKEFFSSDDQLVTLRMYQLGLLRENLDVARRLGLWISSEGLNAAAWSNLEAWDAAGVLDGRHTLNHMYGEIPGRAWDLIKSKGITINVCPRSDSQYGLGAGIGGLQAVLDQGLRPGLSVDNETSYGTDMFTEMRVGYHMQRALATYRKSRNEPNPPAPVSARDMLEFATIRGAECAALGQKIGTLKPGKEADIILIGSADINTMPLTNATATVVQFATNQNVDTVFVSGQVRKWRGKLNYKIQAMTTDTVRKLILDSRDYLLTKRGTKIQIVE